MWDNREPENNEMREQHEMKTRTRKSGFTLIEVLASMAVLVVLMLALTRMFMEAASITKRGTTMLMRNSTAETAMETLLQDAEGMVVNERLACYVRANATDSPDDPATHGYGFGFDDVWFISTSGDQDDDMPYEYVHFFVTNVIATSRTGARYLRFDLMKERMIFAVGDSRSPVSMYALSTNDTQWWYLAQNFTGDYWDRQVLADNVVRFDIYCLGWTNPPGSSGWMAQSGGIHEFDSSVGPNLPGLSPAQQAALRNIPPAAFDIYLQITSPEASEEAGMALLDMVEGNANAPLQLKAREMMIKESASLFGRAVPIIGAAQYNRVATYGTNNTMYYYDKY